MMKKESKITMNNCEHELTFQYLERNKKLLTADYYLMRKRLNPNEFNLFFNLVPRTGVEPARPCEH